MHAIAVEEPVPKFGPRKNGVVGVGGIDCEEAPCELGAPEEALLGGIGLGGFIGPVGSGGAG